MPLIGTLTSGVSALKTFSKGLEVIGGNIANVNTTGYKSASTSFADTFSNTVRTGAGGNSAAQIGSGVQVGAIATNFSQGALSSTGKTTDLGISGKGYFVVQEGTNNYATRDGSFHFATNGDLVNAQGKNVLADDGTKINVNNYDEVSSVTFGADGSVNVIYNPSSTATYAGQNIGLADIADEGKLVKQGNNLYDFASLGIAVTTDLVNANSGAMGKIEAGALELSNVDLTEQFADLITTQRSFQAGARLVTVSDSVLEDIVNLKRS